MAVNPSTIRSDGFVDSLSAGPAGRFADRQGSLHVGEPLPTSVMTGLPGPRAHLPTTPTTGAPPCIEPASLSGFSS